MKILNHSICFLLLFSFAGCSPNTQSVTADHSREDLRDVIILTMMAQDYLKSTDRKEFNMQKLIECDSFDRISQNFKKVELVFHGGYIGLRFTFSQNRNLSIAFTEKEKQMREYWKVIERAHKGDWDGEIQYEHEERFYNFRKILISEAYSTNTQRGKD